MTEEQVEQSKFTGWAIVEMMGHRKEIGYVTTQAFGQAVMFRVDTPELPEREFILKQPAYANVSQDTRRWCPEGTKVKRAAVRPRHPQDRVRQAGNPARHGEEGGGGEGVKPYYEESGITIYHGDCREILPLLPGAPVIADPPYGETTCEWDRRCSGWVDAIQGECLWCFGSLRFFLESVQAFSGWKFAQDLIWEKQNGSGFGVDRFNRVHELIVQWYRGKWSAQHREVPTFSEIAWKASHRVKRRGQTPHRGSIGSVPWSDDGTRRERSVLYENNEHMAASHPTQKPVRIVAQILQYSVPPDGLVIDPFCGSGTTLVAATTFKRRAIGIEIEERYCEIAAKRLSQTILPYSAALQPEALCPST